MTRHQGLVAIPWSRLRPDAVESRLLAAVKTAALVEANSADYVAYLQRVFAADPVFLAVASAWGEDEAEHGAALGEWAQRVDPGFDFAASLARFRAGYRIPLDARASVRGSTTAELLARCVVESGTCSFYSALRDYTREPVLKFICHRIAQDESRHYRLFLAHYTRHARGHALSPLERLRVVAGRIAETGDDELGYAYYCGNLGGAPASPAYDRVACAGRYQRIATGLYRPVHLRALAAMIARASGLNPAHWPVRLAGKFGWWWMRRLNRRAAASRYA